MEKESKGFIKLDRSIFEHWIFQDAEKFKAFVDLIQLARWKDEKLLIGNDIVVVPRGSYYTSILKLAKRWGWGRDKTRNFLSLLEKEKMLTIKSSSKGTMFTIENYNAYQDKPTSDRTTQSTNSKGFINNAPPTINTANQQRTRQHTRQRTNNEPDNTPDTKEEIKEIKEVKEREERKEDTTQPLFFPTSTHELLFNQFGEVSYKTWLCNLDVTDTEIIIYADNETFEKLINKRYVEPIKALTGKSVIVKGVEKCG